MAKDLGGNPWEFTAVGDSEGLANAGETPVPVHLHPIFIHAITLLSGATGTAIEVTQSNAGRTITGPVVMGINDREHLVLNIWVKGIYIQTLPATCRVLVHHGIQGH